MPSPAVGDSHLLLGSTQTTGCRSELNAQWVLYFPEHSKKGLIADCSKELKTAETATKSAIKSRGCFCQLCPHHHPPQGPHCSELSTVLGEDVACQCPAVARTSLRAHFQVLSAPLWLPETVQPFRAHSSPWAILELTHVVHKGKSFCG